MRPLNSFAEGQEQKAVKKNKQNDEMTFISLCFCKECDKMRCNYGNHDDDEDIDDGERVS